MMNIDEKVEYWLDIASYDLKTAQAMLRTRRFLYVGFMCHQVIEKALKAYYWDKCKEIFKKTKELHQWIKKLLKR